MKTTLIMAALALALAGAAAAQTGEGGAGQRGLVRKACLPDIEQLCAGTEPGGGRLIQCLREHQDRLSEACRSALSDARASRRDHAPSASAATPVPAATPN